MTIILKRLPTRYWHQSQATQFKAFLLQLLQSTKRMLLLPWNYNLIACLLKKGLKNHIACSEDNIDFDIRHPKDL